jgi:glycerol-3-phosphate dehydrogenase subunit C
LPGIARLFAQGLKGAHMPHDDFELDNCLKCSVCNTACPVYAAYPEYPGPKHLGPELERLRMEGLDADTGAVEYCLGCHRCDLACPHQVGVSEMIARAKGSHRKTLVHTVRDWWFARPGLLGELLSILPSVGNFFLKLSPVRLMMEKLMRITARRTFPAYTRPYRKSAQQRVGERVLFFPGCFLTYNRPDLLDKVLALLACNGIAAEVVESGCCGVPASANGDLKEAQLRAEKGLAAMATAVDAGIPVLAACASCGHQLKTGFGGALAGDNQREAQAKKLAAQTWDLGEFLAARAAEGLLNTNFHTLDHRVAYHTPCHLNSQGIGRPWVQLLKSIPGVTVDDLNAGCCGMSGTYGFKEEKYKVSMAIGAGLFERIGELKPQLVATECATCQMQIEHGTKLRAVSPLEILLEAYDGRPLPPAVGPLHGADAP